MKHTDVIQIISKPEEFFGKTVTVCGWIRSYRDSKNMAFIALNDGTSLPHLQIVIDKSCVTLPEGAARVGSSVKIEGEAVKSFNKNQAHPKGQNVARLFKNPAPSARTHQHL